MIDDMMDNSKLRRGKPAWHALVIILIALFVLSGSTHPYLRIVVPPPPPLHGQGGGGVS